jgi:hypothetical protein
MHFRYLKQGWAFFAFLWSRLRKASARRRSRIVIMPLIRAHNNVWLQMHAFLQSQDMYLREISIDMILLIATYNAILFYMAPDSVRHTGP